MTRHSIRTAVGAAALATLLASGAHAAPATYEIDSVHSAALFSVTHLGVGTAWGRFNAISGSFVHDAENPAGSRIEVTIDAESVDTANAKRDQHLRSPDFFDVKQFPEITFKSTKVEPIAAGDLEVTGELTFHGVTKTITVRADHVGEGKDPWGNYRKGYDVHFTFRRSDHGVTYMSGGLSDDVKVHFSIEGVRK
jgi:polyisoprenoid-binding protein YceI